MFELPPSLSCLHQHKEYLHCFFHTQPIKYHRSYWEGGKSIKLLERNEMRRKETIISANIIFLNVHKNTSLNGGDHNPRIQTILTQIKALWPNIWQLPSHRKQMHQEISFLPVDAATAIRMGKGRNRIS